MIKISKLRGTGVAIVTPFNKNKEVDFKGLTKLVSHLVKGGVDYLVVLGTTGETVNLTKEEKKAIVKHVVKAVNKQIPVVIGMGGNNTQEILNGLSDPSNFVGIDAILSVSPAYSKPNQRGIYEHYKAISKASPLPIILYNVPGRTSSNMEADTTLKLAHDFKNIIGIKDASGNFDQCMKVIKYSPKDFLMISGDDLTALPLIAVGGDGVISVISNAFPKDFANMTRAILAGKVKDAQKLHYKFTDIVEQIFADGNPAGIKAVLEILNICDANLRLPLVKVNKKVQNNLTDLVKAYK